MKQKLKSILLEIPFGNRMLNSYHLYLEKKSKKLFNEKLKNKTSQDIFTDYYLKNAWGNSESLSGDGSTLVYTENLRKELPALFQKYDIKSLLDAPCGDFNWFHHVSKPETFKYYGGDIVKELIVENKEKYEDSNTTFIELDITQDKLPNVDLWMCRDVLFHFSNKDILLVLNNFLRNKIPYLLTSSHTECDNNSDILTGSFRLLNLEISPFNFSKPILCIEDYIEGFPVRKICLWDRSSIENAVTKINLS